MIEKLNDLMRSIKEFGRLTDYKKNSERFCYSDNFLKNYDERYVFKYIGYNIKE